MEWFLITFVFDVLRPVVLEIESIGITV